MHSRREVDRVLSLVAEGWNDCQISRATGIARTTVGNWRRGCVPTTGTRERSSNCPRCDGSALDEAAYAYLLGLYLGDGHIARMPRTFVFRIVQDARYPHLVNLARATIVRVRNGHAIVGTVARKGCVVIGAYWNHWPCLFPQHGPGRKHARRIALQPWQQQLVSRYPRQLLRGLIHSDGCRCINRVRNGRYSYGRYFFVNSSADILQIFRDT
jgi:hypothetical protein